MVDTDTTINPRPIISLMFGVSVGFWASQLATYATDPNTSLAFDSAGLKSWITLGSGTLFLLDLLCIVWWYARYIYRVQPDASFGTYFLDFVVCSMFALAANGWTKPRAFLIATVFGSIFLVIRFHLLYRSTSASLTDKRLLKRAAGFLGLAVLLALFGLNILEKWVPTLGIDLGFDGHGLPGALSAIGIAATIFLKNKIDVAVDIYTARNVAIPAVNVLWPASEPPDEQQRNRLRDRTKAGLADFEQLFREVGRHDRIHSRVHSDTDLRIQSYVLGISSCETAEGAQEIEKKAFMVAASHWLDDLVDGRNEVSVWKHLQKAPPLSDVQEEVEALFERIYRPLIVKYTHVRFYEKFLQAICDACLFPFNRSYMFLGLNRVAYGALIFSPKLSSDERKVFLDRHNVFLMEWNEEEEGFPDQVEKLLEGVMGSGETGAILLGLTTKTVQEVAMSSENQKLNEGLSILYSILYAPLIYYHNIREELAIKEMIPLQAFDTDCDLWIPWIRQTREVIDGFEGDDRRAIRKQQIEMAYRCFEPLVPKHIRQQLEPIYIRPGSGKPR